jgi:putative transposase
MSPSEYIHKSHNVSVLLYHFVCPAKYRRVVFSKAVDMTLKDVCLEIEKRYDVHFLEIGTDKNHVHYFNPKLRNSKTMKCKNQKYITLNVIFSKA